MPHIKQVRSQAMSLRPVAWPSVLLGQQHWGLLAYFKPPNLNHMLEYLTHMTKEITLRILWKKDLWSVFSAFYRIGSCLQNEKSLIRWKIYIPSNSAGFSSQLIFFLRKLILENLNFRGDDLNKMVVHTSCHSDSIICFSGKKSIF